MYSRYHVLSLEPTVNNRISLPDSGLCDGFCDYDKPGSVYWQMMVISLLVIIINLSNAGYATAQPSDAIISDYYEAAISEPPDELGLDPFYTKYTDAHGIPVTTGEKVPDVALLVARDIVLYMLSERPDLKKQMVDSGFRVGIMAVTDSTTDLPEQRDWKKPSPDDRRLTDGERARYERIANMTDQEYWNRRARGMGGRYTTGAEENILGYPGNHKYYGENILVHEFSHGIHRAIRGADPGLARVIEEAYEKAMGKGLWKGHYGSNTVAEYWAEGTQFWFNSNYDYKHGDTYILSSEDLREYDPALYELLARVYPPANRIPMDVFYNHEARIRTGRD